MAYSLHVDLLEIVMDPIVELEKRIEENKRLVLEQEQALAVLKKAFSGAATSVATPVVNKKSDASQPFNFNDLLVVEKKRNSLTDEIQSVVSTFGKNEFTVLHAEAALLRSGVPLIGKSPRARISLSLAKLVEQNFVEKVFEGSGNIPHRDRLKGESPGEAGLSSATKSVQDEL